jgi:putative hydrolase of the HAD superfamily
MIKIIGFDADDTLWDYEYIYHQAKDKVAAIMGDRFASEQFFAQLDETEIRHIPLYGFGVKSYALSLIESIARHSDQPLTSRTLLALIEHIKQMLNTEFKPYPYAKKILEELAASYPLILITKGEAYEQERKIERSGLAEYFTALEIVSHKTEATYRRVLERHNVSAQDFLMVGNSLKSDVLPVIRIGGQAVLIPHEQTWFHEDITDEEREAVNYYQLEHLGQLPELIERIAGS